MKGDGKPRCRDEWHAGFGREGAGYVPSARRITRCALTSPCLASKISPTQTQWDYLEVLFDALSAFGTPSVIVSDGGGQFYSNQAMEVYAALGIRKERIEKRQAWQNYVRRVGIYWNSCAMQERSRAK